MNNYYFKKENVLDIFESIRKGLVSDKKEIEKAFDLDYTEWEYKVDFNQIINQIDLIKEKEYLPIFSKEKIIDGIGKLCLICNQNPYLIFNFILSSIYTNNKVEVILEDKMLATNKVLIESIKKVLKNLNLDNDTVNYLEVVNKDEIISTQNKYDLIYYFGNKESYINFIKRTHVDTKFENFGEIYLYSDSKDYKENIVEIDKWSYLNEIKVNIYNSNIDDAIKEINKFNNINKMSIIFSKDMEKISKFIKEVKSEKIYVNINSVSNYKFETNLNNFVYEKVVEY